MSEIDIRTILPEHRLSVAIHIIRILEKQRQDLTNKYNMILNAYDSTNEFVPHYVSICDKCLSWQHDRDITTCACCQNWCEECTDTLDITTCHHCQRFTYYCGEGICLNAKMNKDICLRCLSSQQYQNI